MIRVFCALALLGCEPSAPPPTVPPSPTPAVAAGLRLAGDAAATPLMRRLVETFSGRRPGARMSVEAPIGAAGARRAVADGVLDGALLVLDSASPAPEGASAVARSRLVLAVGRGGRLRGRLSTEALAVLFGGVDPQVRMLLRAPDDPLQAALADATPVLAAALTQAYADRRWPVHPDAATLRGALRAPEGAMTIADAGSLKLHGLPVWPVAIEPERTVVFWLLPRADAAAQLGPFITWATGPEGQALVLELGYEAP